MTKWNKNLAQNRIDQIRHFQKEMKSLEEDGILDLDSEVSSRLAQYHKDLISRLTLKFDTDSSDAQKKLSLGMRILTLLGGAALCSSIFFFFYQIWGTIPTLIQVGLLILAPLLALGGMQYFSRREPTLYYTTLLALLACICFVLNLNMLGAMYNITPTQNAFLVWGLFGIFLAYLHGLRLLLIVGLLSLLGYSAATLNQLGAFYWLQCFERPENFIAGGLLFVLIPVFLRHADHYNFSTTYRGVGLLAIFIPVWILSIWGRGSYIGWDSKAVETLYQFLGFVLSGITIWLGVRFQEKATTNIGVTFFTIFLYSKFFEWWWESMPRSLFFFILSLISIGLLKVLKHFHSRLGGQP